MTRVLVAVATLVAALVAPASAAHAVVFGYVSTPYLARADGSVQTSGSSFPPPVSRLSAPIVGIAVHSPAYVVGRSSPVDARGFWLAGSDGGVFAEDGAPFLGSLGELHLNAPIVGIAAVPTGEGYWLVAADGGIFTFGSAEFHGSAGALKLRSPVVGMAATPTGKGYWLVAADGGVFTFGDAPFLGSAATMRLAAPIVAVAPTPTSQGYRLLGRDGGVFTFGDATFDGAGTGASSPAVGAMLQEPCGNYGSFRRDGSYWDVGGGGSSCYGARITSTRYTGQFVAAAFREGYSS